MLVATPPPSNWPSWTTACMVIPQRPLPAPFWPLLKTTVLQSFRKLGRWPHLPDYRSTDHTVAHLFNCPTHPTDLAPEDMWTAPFQVAQFLAGLAQFSDLPLQQIDFESFSSLPSFPRSAVSFLANSGTTSSSFCPSPHFISPVIRGSFPPPLINNKTATKYIW